MDVLIGASALLLVLRYSYYVGRHVLFSTSVLLISATALLFSTLVLLISATTLLLSFVLLISATTLLLSTSVLLISATTLLFSVLELLLCATTPQYCIVPLGTYCVASYSFLMIGLVVKQLYDKNLNT